MKVLTPGLCYSLDNLDSPYGTGEQILKFYGHQADTNGIQNAQYKHEGTTNEEVLMVLISRLEHQQKQQPCQESEQALLKLKEASMWLNSRKSRKIIEEFYNQHGATNVSSSDANPVSSSGDNPVSSSGDNPVSSSGDENTSTNAKNNL